MVARSNPEHEQQVAVVRWLRLVLPKGSKVNHVPNEEVPRTLDPGVRAFVFLKRKAAGVVNGWPDVQCFLPGGRAIFIEMKAPGKGVLSVDQQQIHADLRALGFHVGVATDIDTARAVVRAAGVPLREADTQPAREAEFRLARPKASLNQPVPF